jgi:hypothetical protein
MKTYSHLLLGSGSPRRCDGRDGIAPGLYAIVLARVLLVLPPAAVPAPADAGIIVTTLAMDLPSIHFSRNAAWPFYSGALFATGLIVALRI